MPNIDFISDTNENKNKNKNENMINITCGETTHNIKLGQTLNQILAQFDLAELCSFGIPPIAAVVNNIVQELDYPLYADSKIEWLNYLSPAGLRIYKRSLRFLLYITTKKLFPKHRLKVFHSLNKGIYCELRGESKINKEMLQELRSAMQDLIKRNLPIKRERISKYDAVDFFLDQRKALKAELISLRPSQKVYLYECDGEYEYFFGKMATHTGLLEKFDLMLFDKGFVMLFPFDLSKNFDRQHFDEPKRLQATVRSYKDWSETLKVETISDLNRETANGSSNDLVLIAESMHQRQLHAIADGIYANYPKVKIVLVAGPSSSGKTTFANRLAIEFRALGLKPITISMDNYFLDRHRTPTNNDGSFDFESIYAMDLDLFNEHMHNLVKGKEIRVPRYNFKTGQRENTSQQICHIDEGNIVLLEGIHGLNPLLTEKVNPENKRKIYISCLTQLNIDNYNPVSSSDNRLLRRIARDMKHRNSSPERTISLWPSVRKGEEKNIFPFQENADYYFNSSLIYEIAMLRRLIEPELFKIDYDSEAYVEAQRLLRFLQYFKPILSHDVPLNSIAREFLGGGCFDIS